MISKEKIGEVIKVLSIHGAQVFFDKETGLFRVYLTEYLNCHIVWLNESLENLGVKLNLEGVLFDEDKRKSHVLTYLFSCEEL